MIILMFRQLAVLTLALGFVAVSEQAIFAAVPANDLRSAATPVTIGFSELLNTSEATTDADDAFWNTMACNFPATDASVWYQFVGTGETFRIEVFQSDYSTSIHIAGGFVEFGCGIGGMDFNTSSGQTYYMMVLDDQRDSGGTGGMLNISISLAPPPPDLTVTLGIDSFGSVNPRTGIAEVHGTYTCLNADSLNVQAQVWQDVGPFFVFAYNFAIQFQATCDGTSHAWSGNLYPLDSLARKLHAGRAMTSAWAYSSGPNGDSLPTYVDEQQIILRGR